MSFTLLQTVHSLASSVLTFYMPVFYTFKFVMQKDQMKIQTILKFWVVLSIYFLLSFLLQSILDDKIFPIVDLIILIVINLPPYQIAGKIYETTIGNFYRQNKHTLEKVEGQVQKMFQKNTQQLKNKMKDSTSQKMKGFVGQVLMATLNPQLAKQKKEPEEDRKYESASDTDKDD